MPKKQIIGSILLIIVLSFLCMYIYDNFRVEKETTLIVERGNNNNTIVSYLDTKKVDYYLYNIDNIVVDFPDRDLDLNRALELKQFNIEDVLKYLEMKVEMNDGKVKLYQNDDFSLLECKSDNKTNYIFGDKTMVYRESFCDDKPYLCSFTKTYYIVNIDTKDSKTSYLTLKALPEEVATIEVDSDLVKDLDINKYYKFSFSSTNNKVDGDIKSAFDNNTIKDVTPLLEGESVVNESICK